MIDPVLGSSPSPTGHARAMQHHIDFTRLDHLPGLSKKQSSQIINQQQTTTQSLLSERQWLIDDFHI